MWGLGFRVLSSGLSFLLRRLGGEGFGLRALGLGLGAQGLGFGGATLNVRFHKLRNMKPIWGFPESDASI